MNLKLCPLLVLVLSVCCAAALGEVVEADETTAEKDVATAAQNETRVENEDKIELHHVDEGAGDGNETSDDPVVRKKRTFGDIVFRGLADVLGYRIQRKPPQVTFPPPVAPLYVLAAAPATPEPAPAPQPAFAITLAQAAPQAAQPAPQVQQAPPAPCLVLRAANALPPCARPAAQQVPRVNAAAVTLCAKPRAAPAAQQAAPCAAPRAGLPLCGPAAAAPAQAAPLAVPAVPKETINSNFQLNFNWNRNDGANLAVNADPPVQEVAVGSPAADDAAQPAPQAPAPTAQAAAPAAAPVAPPARILPRPARLPPPRKTARKPPKVFIDAFVDHGNGITQKVNAADVEQYNPRQYDEERAPQQRDYDYEQDYASAPAPARDDYEERPHQPRRTRVDYDYDEEEPQESKSLPRQSKSARAQKKLSGALNTFWDARAENGKQLLVKRRPRNRARALESQQNYQNVHFGDRALARDFQGAPVRKKAQFENLVATVTPKLNRVPLSEMRKFNEAEKFDYESYDQENDGAKAEITTTTEDPNRVLVPAILPPTELHPNKIDTVTVRVPPIYKAKKPKRLHKAGEINARNTLVSINDDYEDIDQQLAVNRPQQPQYKTFKRSRTRRGSELSEEAGRDGDSNERDPYSSDMYDYYGKLVEASPEELEYREMTVPTPLKDADLARVENPVEWEKDAEHSTSENERTDKLSDNAKIFEHEYQNNFVTGSSVQVDDPEFKKRAAKTPT